MKQRVIIIGQGFTSRLCVIRSVAQIGCEIYVIVMTSLKKDGKTLNTRKPVDCYSKYVHQVYYNGGNDGEGLVNLLLTKCVKVGQKAIIITVGDFATKAVDCHLDMLKDYFLFSHIHHRQGAIEEWMNKEKQKALACDIGLNVTHSCNIEIKGGKFSIPSDINYPCFTKTRSYLPGCKSTLQKCDNAGALEAFVEKLSKRFDLTLMVEDYKEIEAEYAVVGFSDGKNVVIPGVIKILAMAHGNHYGVASRGEVLPVDGYEDLIEQFSRFVLNVGFVGIFDIDFFRSEGSFYFGELNLRMGGSGYAYIKSGVNLPIMFVKSLNNEPINDIPHNVQNSTTFVNERMWVGDWLGGFVSTKEFFKCLKNTDISFVHDKYDKAPQKQLYKSLVVSFVKKIAKHVICMNKTTK